MANFYTDNDDIQFLFKHFDVATIAELQEEGFRFHEAYDFAPDDADDAIDNYERILKTVGEICGEEVDPTAEETDQLGNVLNDDGSVTYAPGIANALAKLSQADCMGFTLPYEYGGINCPQFVFTITNDMVTRADAALMNIYGLQGNADTLNAFADEDIKQHYLPRMASGEWTGAMVLTEPDAGSDLQAVKTRAYQDDDGNWFIHGVKRFITNGCGRVLLVLCRTEPDITDGRGLSLLVCENGPTVKIRRLENKLGIHGSPTCEIYFDHVPAQLVGERQRGLITYVMSLMNGARIGIAAQGVGIGEAAHRVARDYAHSRKQFETPIENFPAVRELLVNNNLDLQAARALTYFATWHVDVENACLRKEAFGNLEGDEKKANKRQLRKVGRYNKLLTPMAKYYASEMAVRVSNNAMAVLGGSGYMKDYPVERHLRDARITTIYEGTSQLQVVAAIAGVLSGTCKTVLEDMLEKPSRRDEWPIEVKPLIETIRGEMDLLDECITYTKSQGTQYRDLVARKLVDISINMIVAALFCDFASSDVDDEMAGKKLLAARQWINWRWPENQALKAQILSGESLINDRFEALAGPVPVTE
ncbi:MAG: acyl-CoA dehydrogenase [Planctomycetes bacterium]|jgi:alkylation response protein AidB-like acyl-CoA dehydrogenase|nr:acyl-CoA dehydrogenase [Planctomycetota bacterium]